MPEVVALPAVRSPSSTAARRVLDVVVASLGLALVMVPALLIAVVVKLTSRGPVLFVHHRVGLDGELFPLVKFRTMRDGTDDEVMTDPELFETYRSHDFKLPDDDPRITRVGGFLRRTSLDEIPQLWNVLMGHMSMVGVRPIVREQLEERSNYDQTLYVRYRPGMTGLWQVEGRWTLAGEHRIAIERRHLERRSFVDDVMILARTPGAIVRSSGPLAEGAGTETAASIRSAVTAGANLSQWNGRRS